MPPIPEKSRISPLLPNQLPLGLILILAFIGQLVGVVGLIGYLSFRNGQKTVHDLATQLRSELTARIERELQGYFEIPHEINRLNANAFARGDLDVTGASRGESQLYQQMIVAPTVALVYCGSEANGEFFGVLRSPVDGSLQLSYGNQSNQFYRFYMSLDVAGDRAYFLRQADKPYDARQRPWYKRAVIAERAVWTDIYIAFTTQLPNITASLPVYDRTGRRLLGVCATDIVLPEEFRQFLRNLKIGKHGKAFVVDRLGNLISDSTNGPLMIGEGENAKSLPAIESHAPLVRGTAQYLTTKFGGFEQITQAQRLEFSLDGQRQFLDVVPFQDNYGLDWLIVVVVPESDFMSQINASTRNTAILCILTIGLAVIIYILTARWITRPILQVSHASTAIARGDTEQYIPHTSISEINILANSFNSMARQLKESFASLKQKNEALFIAEENYRSIFENALEGIFQSSHDGYFISVNPAMARIYGYQSPEEMLSNITDIRTQTYVDESLRREFQRQIDEHGLVKAFEFQVYRKDGSIIWIEENARIVRDSSGNVLYYEGIVQDITERKLKEEDLRRQVQQLQIEIDQTKRALQVSEITQTDYFQQILEEADSLRYSDDW